MRILIFGATLFLRKPMTALRFQCGRTLARGSHVTSPVECFSELANTNVVNKKEADGDVIYIEGILKVSLDPSKSLSYQITDPKTLRREMIATPQANTLGSPEHE